LQGGKARQFTAELVKIGTLGGLNPPIQHPVSPLYDGIIGAAARATKLGLNTQASQP
jgi:hypothetical protein